MFRDPRRSTSRVFHDLHFWCLDLDIPREIDRGFHIAEDSVFILQFCSFPLTAGGGSSQTCGIGRFTFCIIEKEVDARSRFACENFGEISCVLVSTCSISKRCARLLTDTKV